jgi:hypothetical protein
MNTFELSKKEAKRNFNGSNRLFEACWRTYRGYLNGGIDNPKDQGTVDAWLKEIAAEKVNNPKSSFYIYG